LRNYQIMLQMLRIGLMTLLLSLDLRRLDGKKWLMMTVKTQ